MKMLTKKLSVCAAAGILATCASAEMLDRPSGIKIGQRMTLRPYVSLSATYDSNVDGSSGRSQNSGDILWTINPAFSLDYKAERWSLLLNGYYNYRAHTKNENTHHHNQHSYGQTLRWNWATSQGAEKGWTLMLSETFQQITMADDMSYGDGSAYSADRYQFSVNGGVQRRFNEHWHAGASANYYLLDYQNDTSSLNRPSLYGWERWAAGVEAGFAPSKWLDILGTLGYQGYQQDNVSGTYMSQQSQGYTAQAGIGSYATERISYRLLGGWSRFEYGGGEGKADGFVYTASGNWRISDTLSTMLLATSYYQPSERARSSQSRVDSVSWGIGKSWIRNKLRTTLDLTYYRSTHESVNYDATDYTVDVATARVSANYTLNRFLSAFISGEYQRSWNDQSDKYNGYCDYDRWRTSIGLRLTY